jgi:NADH:ubiquinone oxidoreductase subunit F (NADH-binding)
MSSFSSPTLEAPATPRAEARPSLPRLLKGIAAHGAMGLERHESVHGPLPIPQGRARRGHSAITELVTQAGLRGRGGASFPTAQKMQAVAGARGRAIVLVNAAEGEPASFKDRTLMRALPHLVLDGAELAAQAVGGREVIVAICESASSTLESAAAAIAERTGFAGSRIGLSAVAVPDHFVAGQETALVNHLNGGPAVPTFTPPMPFERGVRRRPTLVSNAETLAHLALIARHGPRWFRELGTAAEPGSALVTLSGCVAHPGVYEIEHGASLASLIEAAGGSAAPARAALLGGYGGTWIDGSLLGGLALCDEHLAPHGATLGAGVVLLLSEQACPVAETARVAGWLAEQSTGQCGPCVNGLHALAGLVQEISHGAAPQRATQRMDRLASLTARRGACRHPDGAVSFILSAAETFAAEFADHARHGPCEACGEAPEMPLPARSTALLARGVTIR